MANEGQGVSRKDVLFLMVETAMRTRKKPAWNQKERSLPASKDHGVKATGIFIEELHIQNLVEATRNGRDFRGMNS